MRNLDRRCWDALVAGVLRRICLVRNLDRRCWDALMRCWGTLEEC